jgi:hypothetical protein
MKLLKRIEWEMVGLVGCVLGSVGFAGLVLYVLTANPSWAK